MYKVFIENRAVIFYQSPEKKEDITIPRGIKKAYENWLLPYLLKHKEGSVIHIFCEDLEKEMNEIFKAHKPVEAAGGVVYRDEEILVIKRHGLWDLPKGKVEKGEGVEEAAIREVEEECGITKVSIKESLIQTYHTYEMKGKLHLKRTHWFQMNYSENETLVPQNEEGISEVKWIGIHNLDEIKTNTYGSIIDVILEFEKKIER